MIRERDLVDDARQEIHLRDLLRARARPDAAHSRLARWASLAAAALLLVALAVWIAVGPDRPPTPPGAGAVQDEKVIDQAVRDLSSGDLETRERAEETLRMAGTLALPRLRAALESAIDAEVRARLEGVIERLDRALAYSFHDPATSLTWNMRTGQVTPDGFVTKFIEIRDGVAHVLEQAGDRPVVRLDRKVKLGPARRAELHAMLLKADFLKMAEPAAPNLPPPGDGPWTIEFRPGGAKGRTIRGWGAPKELRPLLDWFYALAADPLRFGSVHGEDRDVRPLPLPVVTVQGAGQESPLRLKGRVEKATSDGRGRHVLQVNVAVETLVRVTVGLPTHLELDLPDEELEFEWRRTQGFKGAATGLVVRDAKGIVLLVDDGDYGNAFSEKDTAPFALSLEDAGFRNRKNTPEDLNNFRLVARAEGRDLKLIHGRSGTIEVGGRDYTVLAIRALGAVDDAHWTDAPYTYMSYAIVRRRAK